ncbi:MAG TPA: periplasmic heavy metal sensor [Xanthomonadaceae bacterium]|nr:periplasmic heavy metal sensor [Xanthomonadaceae bacterium]
MTNTLKRPIRVLLIVSLALNMLLGTALATALLMQYRSGAHETRHMDLPSPRALARHLHEHERTRLRAILSEHRPAFRTAGGEVMEARRRVRDALAAEPFEADALASALADLRRGQGRLSTEAQAAIVELAEGMDADGRRRLARAILSHERGRDTRRDEGHPKR